jgi:hypothetical protein
MGQTARQPTTSPALTLGGIPIKSSPLTVYLTGLAVAGWVAVGYLLAIDAEGRWPVAVAGAASSLCVAAVACKAIEVVGLMLARHAEHMTVITEDHASQMKEQIFTLNWMVTSREWAQERAKIDANRFFDGADTQWRPGDTGPFRITNGAG